MRVLILVQDKQRVNLDNLYSSIAEKCDFCEIKRLSSNEQASLKNYFLRNIEVSKYDRIVFFLRFKKEIKQRKFIQSIPNLVILEHDAFQNYTGGKYHGKFSEHYRLLPWVRIICSGYNVIQKLKNEGFDVHFVSKGYDSGILYNTHSERDIYLGFVGSTKNKLYIKRKAIIDKMIKNHSLFATRTNSADEYRNTLNRIKIFFSADIGFGEYMIKNFEAMACGCLLLAYDQGESENKALGFINMKNVVLYKNYKDACEKLEFLKNNPDKIINIAAAGQKLVEFTRTNKHIGKQIANALIPPLRKPVIKKSFLGLKKQISWEEPGID